MNNITYKHPHFDILRYEIAGWDTLPSPLKHYLYHLSEACLAGRDIIYFQHHPLGLVLRELLEKLWENPKNQTPELEEYLSLFWLNSGIHHHYEEYKIRPKFTEDWFWTALEALPYDLDQYFIDTKTNREEVSALLFSTQIDPYRRATTGDENSLLERSSINFYAKGITQQEATTFYNKKTNIPIAPGLNSRLNKNKDGVLYEEVASTQENGLYREALQRITGHLRQAITYAPTKEAEQLLELLIAYYETGDLRLFDAYSRAWVGNLEEIDMIHGFIETYSDPLGLKGSWEAILQLIDHAGTERTSKVNQLSKPLEEDSPIDDQFKRKSIGKISNRAIQVITLAGDSYPSSPLGVNLPNDERTRAEVGSKSVSLSNISDALNRARLGNSLEVFYYGDEVKERIKSYGVLVDNLHTDLHEGIGHASGKLADGVRGDALRELDSVIEEARADLNALYFIAHPLLLKEGLLPNPEAYKTLYDLYLTRALLVQLTKLEGSDLILRQAHMQNRSLIANWLLELAKPSKAVSIECHDEKHFVVIQDYEQLRSLFGEQLREIQRIKSTGDYPRAKQLIEQFATNVDPLLWAEVHERNKATGNAPYVGFVNPVISPLSITFEEGYFEQNLRYSKEYRTLSPNLATYPKPKGENSPEGEWHLLLNDIRQELKRGMAGVVSDSMREKGVHYGINFGVNTIWVKEMSQKLPKSEELAWLLWKKDVREMKLLALYTFPSETLNLSTLLYLSRTAPTLEILEQILQILILPHPKALELIFQIDKSESPLTRTLPYLILSGKLRTQDTTSLDSLYPILPYLQTQTLIDLGQNNDLDITIFRTYQKIAEQLPDYRPKLHSFATTLLGTPSERANALGEEIEDLLSYFSEEENL